MPRAKKPSDTTLLERWYFGRDAHAFEQFRQRHNQKVTNVLSEFVKTPEPLVDEVFDRLANLDTCPRQPRKKLTEIQGSVLLEHRVVNPQDVRPPEPLRNYRITRGPLAQREPNE